MSEHPRVLVVDDDRDISEMVSLVLEEHGCEVVNAEHGLDALERVRAGFHPDVILLDMRMPVLDGQGFVASYRAEPPPHAPIIVVSAARDAQESAEAVAAQGWLAKPFDIDELVQVVRRHTDAA